MFTDLYDITITYPTYPYIYNIYHDLLLCMMSPILRNKSSNLYTWLMATHFCPRSEAVAQSMAASGIQWILVPDAPEISMDCGSLEQNIPKSSDHK